MPYVKHRNQNCFGRIILALHAHIPYVLFHGKWPHGSDWLCEAACETYVPLLNMIGRLEREGKRANLTVDLTPVLCEMLGSEEFRRLLKAYIVEKVEAASVDRNRFAARGQEEQAIAAEFWGNFYAARLDDFVDVYKEDLLAAFGGLQERGQIELTASAATHAYLPLLDLDISVAAQISQGTETYRRYFGREPRGMWLPECGYRPSRVQNGQPQRRGIDSLLASRHLRYSFLDGHLFNTDLDGMSGVNGSDHTSTGRREGEAPGGGSEGRLTIDPRVSGQHRGPYREMSYGRPGDIYRIYRTGHPETGTCAFFPRDGETSGQVWSSDWGYPGDPWYLEFHKKHSPGGLRYWRITDRNGDLGAKELYDGARASERLREHAAHFRKTVEGRLRAYTERTGRAGVMTVPFDAELFGHWWFEGVYWLYEVISAFGENYDTMISQASDVLSDMPPADNVEIREGSWGQGGGHHIWYNKETEWTWELIHRSEKHMCEAAGTNRYEGVSGRLLKQMARELFLMQSSDWQFLITNKTAGDYGRSRFSDHHEAFERLRSIMTAYHKDGLLDHRDVTFLAGVEERDAVFDDIRVEWFRENQPR